MRLESERLILEPMSEKYFEGFMMMDMDPEVMKFIRKASVTEAEVRERFERLKNYMSENSGLGGFAVVEKHSGEMVGIGFLIHIEMNTEYGHEVGYRFMQKAWGKGYATEVSKELIRYGFEVKGLPEIFGTTNPDHKVSQKTLKKAGLIEIGSGPYHGGCTLFKIKSYSFAI
jgi:[ribosomal protein S5]-alanine N-acetyltransferase